MRNAETPSWRPFGRARLRKFNKQSQQTARKQRVQRIGARQEPMFNVLVGGKRTGT
jgi:hypothetical protein